MQPHTSCSLVKVSGRISKHLLVEPSLYSEPDTRWRLRRLSYIHGFPVSRSRTQVGCACVSLSESAQVSSVILVVTYHGHYIVYFLACSFSTYWDRWDYSLSRTDGRILQISTLSFLFCNLGTSTLNRARNQSVSSWYRYHIRTKGFSTRIGSPSAW